MLENVGLNLSGSKTEYLLSKESNNYTRLKEYSSTKHVILPQKATFKYLAFTINLKAGCRAKVQVLIDKA